MAAQYNQGPFRIASFRDFVPQPMCYVLLFLFAAAFQLSGGVYLASVSQMVGGKVLLEEDIRMAGYMSFIGLTMAFPLVFRIKFRFKSRDIIMGTAAIIGLCNIITMYTRNLPLLMAASFVTGSFRLIGTFECMSSMQGKFARGRDQTLFFCILFTVILSMIQFSGIAAVYMDYFYNWQYMHVLVVGVMVFVMVCAFFLMKDFRAMKPLPLYGIDWMGFALWAVFLISGAFTLQYGKHFDWFDSVYIRAGTVVCAVSFLLAVRRMHTARRPYFNPEIFGYRNFKSGMALTFAMVLMLATANAVQGAFTSGILHYDSLNSISLNWWVLAGIAVGTPFVWYAVTRLRWGYKRIIFIGFACLTAYQVMMYFLIDPGLNIEAFYLPSFIRGTGNAILYVCLTLYAIENIPFKYFLQHVGLLGFVRTGIGTVAGAALLSNWMTWLVKKNSMLLSWELDAVHAGAAGMPSGALYGEVARQAMLVSIKELFGWFAIGGLIVLLLVMTMKYVHPIVRILPRMRTYRRYIRIRYRLQ